MGGTANGKKKKKKWINWWKENMVGVVAFFLGRGGAALKFLGLWRKKN